jgi:hypothetical protein
MHTKEKDIQLNNLFSFISVLCSIVGDFSFIHSLTPTVPCTTPSEKEGSLLNRSNVVEDEWISLAKELHGIVSFVSLTHNIQHTTYNTHTHTLFLYLV